MNLASKSTLLSIIIIIVHIATNTNTVNFKYCERALKFFFIQILTVPSHLSTALVQLLDIGLAHL